MIRGVLYNSDSGRAIEMVAPSIENIPTKPGYSWHETAETGEQLRHRLPPRARPAPPPTVDEVMAQRKMLVDSAFSEFEKGNVAPLRELMSEAGEIR